MRFAGPGAIAIFGAMLTVSVLGQPVTPPTAPPVKPQAVAPVASPEPAVPTLSWPVDINAASADELGKVKFIGRKRAAAIIAGRPWQTPDDLVVKKVVPRKYFDQIKDQLVAK
jgi:competence protein ComEA